MSVAAFVKEFHEKFGLPIGSSLLDAQDVTWNGERQLRLNLLAEEFGEYMQAEEENNIVEIADGLGDMLYIIYGTALAYGINLDKVVAEIHRSNMTKLGADGKPVIREDGKVMKGPGYSRPGIGRVLFAEHGMAS